MGSKRPELNLAADYSQSQGVLELRCARDVHTQLSPEASLGFTLSGWRLERSSSHRGLPRELRERKVGAQDSPPPTPTPRPDALSCTGQQRLTCPRRIRQPLDCSNQAPLEKFPNFFAALHAFASGRPNESQKEETTPAHAPGRCVHHLYPGHSFPRRGAHSPRAPCTQALEKARQSNLPRDAVAQLAFRDSSGTQAAPAST